ncbi:MULTISPECIES: tripartite tricarboxylate transporter TctB family protein [unclassified Bosea (in: a-proteobacteria)]|uniref:tripartite tricarboxylate transporter TctB family protein n=1 Tax=unclassified Bosea (in: a-proteobacteria) TaxID=2653178 RepID=UPI000F75B576|nr:MULTISPECIES: tripartite tricarboxylate transporter TctB family protein [unclassified Bosea (in: a-proteobacteria)]AZO77799.1 small permease of tripartite tricarboxylate transporter [Bosea sp. Tri-49]RXT18415.1 small permease of tripartite tricarboxylate transporter [Bosea sp. Tri-39]RXT33011.1 small permease of tripartite tricarboxylate transporter [Bosea sp. Tri-54]
MSSKAPGRIAGSKDLWSGLIFIGFGLLAMALARGYAMGHAGRMGPGYFPTALGGVLAVIGLVLVVQAFLSSGEAVTGLAWRKAALVLVASGLFGVTVEGLGLAASTVLLVMISGLASEQFRLWPFLALAIGLSAFSVLTFVTLLGLPIPAFGPWLGF